VGLVAYSWLLSFIYYATATKVGAFSEAGTSLSCMSQQVSANADGRHAYSPKALYTKLNATWNVINK